MTDREKRKEELLQDLARDGFAVTPEEIETLLDGNPIYRNQQIYLQQPSFTLTMTMPTTTRDE